MADRTGPDARELADELDRLTHPFAEAMSDRARLDAFVAVGVRVSAALRAAGPSADEVRREALENAARIVDGVGDRALRSGHDYGASALLRSASRDIRALASATEPAGTGQGDAY